ncbi:MAG: SurA N-terminal domain-containing protein [Candidatus Gastranaerophilaceae bacterium]
MKRNAFGAIDLLIGLVITAFLFIMMNNVMKGTNSLKINDTPIDTKSVQEHIDQQVNEIENMRQQTIDFNKQSEEINF